MRAGQRLQGLMEFFGARVVGRRSPGHIDRVASAPPPPTGERIVDAHDLCAYGVTVVSLRA